MSYPFARLSLRPRYVQEHHHISIFGGPGCDCIDEHDLRELEQELIGINPVISGSNSWGVPDATRTSMAVIMPQHALTMLRRLLSKYVNLSWFKYNLDQKGRLKGFHVAL